MPLLIQFSEIITSVHTVGGIAITADRVMTVIGTDAFTGVATHQSYTALTSSGCAVSCADWRRIGARRLTSTNGYKKRKRCKIMSTSFHLSIQNG